MLTDVLRCLGNKYAIPDDCMNIVVKYVETHLNMVFLDFEIMCNQWRIERRQMWVDQWEMAQRRQRYLDAMGQPGLDAIYSCVCQCMWKNQLGS